MGLQIFREKSQRYLGPKINNALEMKKNGEFYLGCSFGFENLAWFVLISDFRMSDHHL